MLAAPRDRRPDRAGSIHRLAPALGVWAGVVGLAGVLALQLGAATAEASDAAAAMTATAAIATPVAPTITTVAPTTTVLLPTTATTAVPPTTELPAPPTTATTVAAPPPTEAPAPLPEAPAAASASAPVAVPADLDAASEIALLDDHNQRRAASGLPSLLRDPCLDEVARSWARQMASGGTLRHNPTYAAEIDGCITYTAAGENVGQSPDIPTMTAHFWASDAHRANIVGPFEYVGIGVVIDADGQRWAAIEFAAG